MLSVHIGDPTNLAAVFRGELWRGRDAVRLALRSPWKAESLRGILFPLVTLAGLLSFAAGIVSAIAGTPLWPLWLGIGLIAMPVAAVFLTLLIRRGNRPDSGVGLAGIGALAVVYTTARGLAPIFPGGHNLRRKG
jgi:hypothetical protein